MGVGVYDFHAGMYDATLGRTFQMDPHMENYLSLSPYSWAANNPLIFTDPTGMDIELGNLYEKDDDGNYKYETSIKAFEAFAATKLGRDWIGSRAQEGFEIDFAYEKGGISIEEAGDMSSVVDYNFKVGEDTKGGIALAEYNTDGEKLKIDITFDKSSSERKNPDAYSFMQMGDAVFHETNFHGFHAERRYMNGERNANNLSTGTHKQSDLENSPFGQKGYSYYLYLANKRSTKNMAGYEKYSKYSKHSEKTYNFWWNEFMGQFTK